MFNTLLESKPKRKRTVGGTVISVVAHTAIIFFAVYATANARIAEAPKPKQENLKFVEVKKEEPKPEPPKPEPPKPEPPKAQPKAPPAPTPPAPRLEAPPPPKGFQTLQAPVEIPVSIPQVDLSARITNEADFSGKGVAGGSSEGVAGGTPGGTGTGPALDVSEPFREHEVEVAVSPLGNVAPTYPSSLRESGVEGQVIVEFVVTENGRVDLGSVKIIESSHALFTSSVKTALGKMRFSPAKVGGTSVKQYVRQPFTFKLERT